MERWGEAGDGPDLGGGDVHTHSAYPFVIERIMCTCVSACFGAWGGEEEGLFSFLAWNLGSDPVY